MANRDLMHEICTQDWNHMLENSKNLKKRRKQAMELGCMKECNAITGYNLGLKHIELEQAQYL